MLSRQAKDALRTPDAAIVNIVQSIVLGLIVGSIFYQLSGPSSFFPRAGLLFFSVLSGAFPITSIAVLVKRPKLLLSLSFSSRCFLQITLRRPVVNRERASGVYSVLAYFLVRTLVDSVICVILPILFNGIIYYMAGLRPDASGEMRAV